jgi:exonuclease VII large subunit
VVSAIGHEPDTPLLDYVADLRCSTPTDAGKRIVPDLREETERVRQMRDRGRRALHGWVDTQARLLNQIRSRPALADPLGPVQRRQDDVDVHRERARRDLGPQLRRLSEATSMQVGSRWWFADGAGHRKRVAGAQENLEEAIADGDGQEFALAFVGYDHAMASAVVCANSAHPSARKVGEHRA